MKSEKKPLLEDINKMRNMMRLSLLKSDQELPTILKEEVKPTVPEKKGKKVIKIKESQLRNVIKTIMSEQTDSNGVSAYGDSRQNDMKRSIAGTSQDNSGEAVLTYNNDLIDKALAGRQTMSGEEIYPFISKIQLTHKTYSNLYVGGVKKGEISIEGVVEKPELIPPGNYRIVRRNIGFPSQGWPMLDKMIVNTADPNQNATVVTFIYVGGGLGFVKQDEQINQAGRTLKNTINTIGNAVGIQNEQTDTPAGTPALAGSTGFDVAKQGAIAGGGKLQQTLSSLKSQGWWGDEQNDGGDVYQQIGHLKEYGDDFRLVNYTGRDYGSTIRGLEQLMGTEASRAEQAGQSPFTYMIFKEKQNGQYDGVGIILARDHTKSNIDYHMRNAIEGKPKWKRDGTYGR